MQLIRYGLLRRMKRGISLAIDLTFKCNYKCSICSLHLVNGRIYPEMETKSFEFWKKFIDDFPIPIQEIYLSGGEPVLVKYLPLLTNYLLNKKICVSIWSNISIPEVFEAIIHSKLFRIVTVYHPDQTDLAKFLLACEQIRNYGLRLDVEEIGDKQFIAGSTLKPFWDMERINKYKCKNRFYVDPFGRMFTSYHDLILENSRNKF
jgi:organic radical activating enzyme